MVKNILLRYKKNASPQVSLELRKEFHHLLFAVYLWCNIYMFSAIYSRPATLHLSDNAIIFLQTVETCLHYPLD